ncbi:MAG: efflux RND transporter periplasmic adaptor subunit [Gammaproteobacteria bacterium]|nr:efflux RND transporter periplasmic adaptor subunit [Gammaproteobacteria bacterium]
MRAYLIVIVLLLAIFGSIGGYQYVRFSKLANADFSPPPVTIAAALATRETWGHHLDAVGTIKAVRGVNLGAETSGQITALNFDSGDTVEAGKLLLVLNDDVEQASRQNEIATLNLAKILYERDLKLIAQKSISQTQFDRSRVDLERARAQLAETEARIRNKRIFAPFAGRIGIRRVDLGDYIAPGTMIASLQDLSRLDVDFTLPARYASQLHPGLAIALQVDAFPDRVFAAELQALDTSVDPGTRNLLLRARVLEPGELLPGMFATLQLDLGAQTSVVTVPETAVTYSLQGDTVFVIENHPDGGLAAVSRIVKAGETRNGRTELLAGLQEGERVATVGQNKLYRGVKVLIDDTVDI